MEEPTDKETTTPSLELEQSVTSEPSNLAVDEVRRGQRTRTMTEKARENKITALTNSLWKLHGKFAREIIQTETTLGKFCTNDTLREMEVNLEQGLQEIEHICEEMKMLSTAASDQTIRMATCICMYTLGHCVSTTAMLYNWCVTESMYSCTLYDTCIRVIGSS